MSGYLLKIVPSKLTDGSRVFDVYLSDSEAEPLIINCVSRDDAFALAEKIATTIKMHTNDAARVIEADYYMVR